MSSLNGKGKLLLPALCGIHCKSCRPLNKGKRSAVCGNREYVFCPDDGGSVSSRNDSC